ncbi:hypothetical protein C4B68_22240 [Streptomyces dengpaensis]|uniref:Secreted protein n=1 Tax=Streptomyces dengpaensis TaxID=2049881 RepID=A0ABM6STI3_9ACTN|nr:hypothetical protein C4B68_22240 [Streptomyces dengpaensis]
MAGRWGSSAFSGCCWGRPLLCQCRASASRVKGAALRFASAAPIGLRPTLDSARSSTGEKRAGGPEGWVAEAGGRQLAFPSHRLRCPPGVFLSLRET